MLMVQDMAASLHFYTHILGFEFDEGWPNKEQPLWASLSLNDQVVMIGAAMEPDPSWCEDEDTLKLQKEMLDVFQKGTPGAGVSFYFVIDGVDEYFSGVKERGGKPRTEPKTQFYGLRDFMILDPDGYRLQMYSYVQLSECQSCGMPLTDAEPGDMYCNYCTTDDGKLRSYEEVLQGTIQGYFIGMQGMEADAAAVAAKEHLAKMPAWKCRE